MCEDVLAAVQRLITEEGDLDGAIQLLRGEGIDKIATIRLLVEKFGYTLARAKQAVHQSEAWADRSVVDEEIWKKIQSSVE